MQSLIGLKDRFDIAFACDTDHDRHGIVTQSTGLLPPNHYLSAAIHYLFPHRPKWNKDAVVGETVVSSQMLDRVAAKTICATSCARRKPSSTARGQIVDARSTYRKE